MKEMCANHPSADANVYCFNENQFYCSFCNNHQHSGHQVVSFNNAKREACYKKIHDHFKCLCFSMSSLKKALVQSINHMLIKIQISYKAFENRIINMPPLHYEAYELTDEYSCMLSNMYQNINLFVSKSFLFINENKKNSIHYWKNNTIYLYDPCKNHAESIVLNKPINDYAESITLFDRIFIFGGYKDNSSLNEAYEADTTVKLLLSLAPMPSKKSALSLCNHNELIYTIGGYSYCSLNNCESYSTITGHWSTLPRLSTPRCHCASFVWDSYIYAYCGNNDYDNQYHLLNSMERLSLENMSVWASLYVSFDVNPRSRVHAVVNDKCILIIGGYNFARKFDDCWKLVITDGVCDCILESKLAKPSEFMRGPCSINANGTIYAFDAQKELHILHGGIWIKKNID